MRDKHALISIFAIFLICYSESQIEMDSLQHTDGEKNVDTRSN